MVRNDDMPAYIEDGKVIGSEAQKSCAQSFIGLHLLHWQNTDAMKVLADWKAAGVNPLPESIITGVMPITPENADQFVQP